MRTNPLRLCFWLALATATAGGASGELNLIRNPNFGHIYAARRLIETNRPYIRAEHTILPGYAGAPFLPYGWAVVPGQDGQGVLASVHDADGPALRIQVGPGERMRVRQHWIEVVPGASYTAGLRFKGQGRIEWRITVHEPATHEVLIATNLEATAAWQTVRLPIKVGLHRHLAGYAADVVGPADVCLRAAELSCHASRPDVPAGSVDGWFASPPGRDQETLFEEHFDGPTSVFQLNSGAFLTDEQSGRFGRALVMSPQNGGAVTRLTFGALPSCGTIEFWYQPTACPTGQLSFQPVLLTTQTPGASETKLRFDFNFWFEVDAAPTTTCLDLGLFKPGTMQSLIASITGPPMPPTIVNGTINLQDFEAPLSSQTVTLYLRPAAGGSLTAIPGVALGNDGSYSFSTTLCGRYQVLAKGSHWLRKQFVGTVDLLGAPVSGVNFSLFNGDCNNDNEVNIGDFGVLSAAFGSSPGDGNWNAMADLNGDESVDIGDFAILSSNFGRVGDN